MKIDSIEDGLGLYAHTYRQSDLLAKWGQYGHGGPQDWDTFGNVKAFSGVKRVLTH
jgi:predicted DNA-binding WGR domain protein